MYMDVLDHKDFIDISSLNHLPPYITATLSATFATTPKSCVIKIIDVSIFVVILSLNLKSVLALLHQVLSLVHLQLKF